MPGSSGTVTWGTSSVTMSIGESITVAYAITGNSSQVEAGYLSSLNSIASISPSPGQMVLTGTATGTVTIPSNTTVAYETKTTNSLEVTVTAPVEDTEFLNKRGLTHFWSNISGKVPIKRETIYTNVSGTNANFSTTSAMSNYDDVEITFRDTNSNYATLTVPGSAGSFVLSIVHPGASSVAYWYISRFIVSGTSITVGANNTRKALQASSLATTATQDIYITKMVGIKY